MISLGNPESTSVRIASGSTTSSETLTGIRRGFFTDSCSILSPGAGCCHQRGRQCQSRITYPFIRPDHTDLSALGSKFLFIKLDYCSLGVFLQRVCDVSDTLGLAAFLLRCNKSVPDGTNEGEVGQEVGGGRGVGQRGDEDGRAVYVSRQKDLKQRSKCTLLVLCDLFSSTCSL